MARCGWLDETKKDYVEYHDQEWGVPVYDDKVFFEFLLLESAQAGLSWYTILKRRQGYREAFAQFDPAKVAEFDAAKVEILLQNEAIIRHRAKIEAAINNAKQFIAIQNEFGSFSDYVWGFVGHKPIDQRSENQAIPATTKQSDLLFNDLKKRGFKFLGSTTVYAFMQATGLVNDHDLNCIARQNRSM
ncbi:DNA-3-methyladenine glycosylase I [Vibrio sp. TH_r3]|uniref:DNA-3-methyladenine glycosylase I n=1 Tax=Vibrio sp. TH_r3 TaxID=3082084 RepID=UPI002953F601|nr:DNA-3-methyladenine glycosylase I [Vibrio sp. TH_r3]MDV7102967.1 DNA-3-methyladenine glycosylase I [Vibrio sp. TH_r3]